MKAIARARFENTPTLIEAKTYRYRGHSMSDPAAYRTAEEVEQKKKEDPILMLKALLIQHGVNEPKLQAIDDAAKHESHEAVEFAAKSPEPSPEEALTDVVSRPWDEKMLPKIALDGSH